MMTYKHINGVVSECIRGLRVVVKIGFIGSGGIAERHTNQLLRIKNAKVVAFSDLILDRAKNLAKLTGANAYSDAQEMLKKESLDAIYLCTPPYVRDLAIAIADKGLDIFIEKPVALSINNASKIERALIKSGVINAVGYQFRYFDTSAHMRDLIHRSDSIPLVEGHDYFPLRVSDTSQIGDFFTVPPNHWILRKEKSGEHIVESSTHVFDLARYLVGEVKSVYAEFDTSARKGIPNFNKANSTVVIMKFENGAIGVISNTLTSPKSNLLTTLKVTVDQLSVEHGCHSGKLKIFEDNKITELNPTKESFLEEDRTFIEAVATRNQELIKSSYTDGIKTLKLTLAAVKAAQSKQLVTLKDPPL
jgi:predicted dehydrogenase